MAEPPVNARWKQRALDAERRERDLARIVREQVQPALLAAQNVLSSRHHPPGQEILAIREARAALAQHGQGGADAV